MTTNVRVGRRIWVALLVALAAWVGAPPDVAAERAAARAASSKPQPKRSRAAKRTKPTPPTVAIAIGGSPATGAHDLARAESPAERAAAKIEALFRGALRQGTTSIYVADAHTGAPLFELDPDRPLNPASNVKLLSTAAALDLLGPDHRYRTRVVGLAPDAGGTVDGGLYLLGSYDPTLDTGDVRRLADALIDAGVRRVDGDLVVGPTPTRDGIYRAGVSVEIRAGDLGEPAVASLPAGFDGYDLVEIDVSATKTRKRRGDLRFEQRVVVDDAGHTRLRLTVRGPIGRGRNTSKWIRFDDLRAHHTAHVLAAALRGAGVEVTGDVRVAELPAFVAEFAPRQRLPIALAEHASAPLADVVAKINKRSINWLADRVIMTAAGARYHEAPSMPRAIEAMHAWLAQQGSGAPEVVVDTGSGLSRRTQFSARHIVDVLRRAGGFAPGADAEAARAYLDSLSVAGVDGTLRNRFAGGEARGRLRGKTGTLRDSIALSGVLEVDPTRPLAFAIVTNGHPTSAKLSVRRAHETLVAAVCEYLHATGATPAAPALAAAAPPPAAPDEGGELVDPADAE